MKNREEQIAKAASKFVPLIAQKRFKAGARWADEHPKSPWISVKDRLPQSKHSVMLALSDGTCSTGSLFGEINGENYWDIDRGDDFVEVNDNDYWMPIPELNKSENQ